MEHGVPKSQTRLRQFHFQFLRAKGVETDYMMDRDYHFHVSSHKSTNLIQELQLYNLISSQSAHLQRPSQSEFGFQPRDKNTESVAAPYLSLTL